MQTLQCVVDSDADTWIDDRTPALRLVRLVRLVMDAWPGVPITVCCRNVVDELQRQADDLQLYQVRPGHYAQPIGWARTTVTSRAVPRISAPGLGSEDWQARDRPAPSPPPVRRSGAQPATWLDVMRQRWVDSFRPGALEDRELSSLVITKTAAQRILQRLLPDQSGFSASALHLVAPDRREAQCAAQWATLMAKRKRSRWQEVERAAARHLVYEARYTLDEVAARMGITRQSLSDAAFRDDAPVGSPVQAARR